MGILLSSISTPSSPMTNMMKNSLQATATPPAPLLPTIPLQQISPPQSVVAVATLPPPPPKIPAQVPPAPIVVPKEQSIYNFPGVSKVSNETFERYSQNFSKKEPNILFVVEYFIENKSARRSSCVGKIFRCNSL